MQWSLNQLGRKRAGGPRAFIYCRVSTKRQADTAVSLSVQADLCTQFAERLGIPLSCVESNVGLRGVWQDLAVSASKVPIHERPGFRKMWSHMKQGDAIIVLALDRAWRHCWDFTQSFQVMKASNISVHFANTGESFGTENDSPMTRFMLTNQANLAQLKSELISARVKEYHMERKAKMLSTTGSPEECKVASESGVAESGHRIEPINYTGPGPDWGAMYRDLQLEPISAIPKQGRVFGYARVSTDDQSCETQISMLRRAIENRCGAVYDCQIFADEGVSAYKVPWKERGAGKQMWDQLQDGDHVMIVSADRAFRSIVDMALTMETLDDKGVTLHFLRDGINTSTKGGRRLLQSLSLAAQWERDDMSERIGFSLENARRERGAWLGSNIARWIRIRNEFGRRILMVDPDDMERTILITKMIRNKGKTSWPNLVKEIENECAERDGRRVIPASGCDLRMYRNRCSESERFALNQYILRRRNNWSMSGFEYGTNMKGGKDTLMPEVSISMARKWDNRVWDKLLNYVAVKPDIFGEYREKILEVG